MRPSGKYGIAAKIERTYGGIVFRSKAEARYAKWLDVQCRTTKKGIHRWEYEPERFPLYACADGVRIETGVTYMPDFRVTMTDGTVELHEVKGVLTEGAAIKLKFFRACYPAVIFKLIDARTLRERSLNGPSRPNKRKRLANLPGPRSKLSRSGFPVADR